MPTRSGAVSNIVKEIVREQSGKDVYLRSKTTCSLHYQPDAFIWTVTSGRRPWMLNIMPSVYLIEKHDGSMLLVRFVMENAVVGEFGYPVGMESEAVIHVDLFFDYGKPPQVSISDLEKQIAASR
jgi:hypothetical protein